MARLPEGFAINGERVENGCLVYDVTIAPWYLIRVSFLARFLEDWDGAGEGHEFYIALAIRLLDALDQLPNSDRSHQ